MSQNLVAIQNITDFPFTITFSILNNNLPIENNTAIKFSGLNNLTGTNLERFTNEVNENETYYVKNLSDAGSGQFDFEIARSVGGDSINASGSFNITNANVVSISLAGAICFLGDSEVDTDQGKILLKDLSTKNTINGHKIKKVTNMINIDNYMVLFKKVR